jgi:hypothetical protein
MSQIKFHHTAFSVSAKAPKHVGNRLNERSFTVSDFNEPNKISPHGIFSFGQSTNASGTGSIGAHSRFPTTTSQIKFHHMAFSVSAKAPKRIGNRLNAAFQFRPKHQNGRLKNPTNDFTGDSKYSKRSLMRHV